MGVRELRVFRTTKHASRQPAGPHAAAPFTLSRKSPSHTGVLSEEEYRAIFNEATGIYGTNLIAVDGNPGG